MPTHVQYKPIILFPPDNHPDRFPSRNKSPKISPILSEFINLSYRPLSIMFAHNDVILKMAAPMTLATASANGDIHTVKALIHEGVDVNQRSHDGFVPLCVAAFWGYSEIVEYLLRHSADVNTCNSGTGWTALHCAAFQGHGKVIMKLMEHNPNLNVKDDKGRTSSDFASAMDSIWPIFAAAGCRRTPKSELIRLDIIKKVKDDPAIPKSDYSFYSRPGSAYVMKSQPMRGQARGQRDEQMDYAAATGDVLALHGDGLQPAHSSNPSFNIWRN